MIYTTPLHTLLSPVVNGDGDVSALTFLENKQAFWTQNNEIKCKS